MSQKTKKHNFNEAYNKIYSTNRPRSPFSRTNNCHKSLPLSCQSRTLLFSRMRAKNVFIFVLRRSLNPGHVLPTQSCQLQELQKNLRNFRLKIFSSLTLSSTRNHSVANIVCGFKMKIGLMFSSSTRRHLYIFLLYPKQKASPVARARVFFKVVCRLFTKF